MANKTLDIRAGGMADRQQDTTTALLNQIAPQVLATPLGGAPPPAWILLDPLNGYAVVATSFAAPPAYHIDALRYVHTRISVFNNTGAPLAATLSLVTLPKGARPKSPIIFTSTNGTAFVTVTIGIDGSVKPNAAIGVGNDVNLNVTFLAEQ